MIRSSEGRFLLIAREVKAGKFTLHAESFGLASGVIQFISNPALELQWPAGLKARIEAARDSIEAGTLTPAGPVTP